MEALQLSVLDLPPQNVLEILPRFKLPVAAKDDRAIAKFGDVIKEIRLDQLPDQLAGNGKNDRQIQEVLPVEIKISSIDDNFSGISPQLADIPENTLNIRKHGCIEDYLVKSKLGKIYKYERYVYLDTKGKYRHHHIPHKQLESISALWASGATPKQICTALGKICKLK